MWLLLVYVTVAGGVGGVVNALVNDQGFRLPSKETVDKLVIYRPGWIGNVIIGAIAAAVSWGLYGPLAAYSIAGGASTAGALAPSSTSVGLTLSSLVGAVLIGIGGARWLTNEVDKTLLRAAASKAASAQSHHIAAGQIALASPIQALHIAKNMP